MRYRYQCDADPDHNTMKMRRVDDRNEPFPCDVEDCDGTMRRNMTDELTSPQEFESYVDYNLGPEPIKITSRGQKKKIMKEEGLWAQKSFGSRC